MYISIVSKESAFAGHWAPGVGYHAGVGYGLGLRVADITSLESMSFGLLMV